MGSLEGKVALVTGASRGIGKAIALELAREGARVALNYRSGEAQALAVDQEIAGLHAGLQMDRRTGEAQARVLADEVSARVITVTLSDNGTGTVGNLGDDVMLARADVGNSQEARDLIRRVVDRWGRLDILVNNAGITRDRTLRKLTDDDWLTVINTNLNSVFFCTSAAIPVMIEQNYGRIVNISSVIGQAGNVGQANYAAAKAGMIAFAKSAALELARFNITVNVVAPGFTATEMLSRVPEAIQDQIKAKIPLGRFAKTEEIAEAVKFLVSGGNYITGQQINVNGGIYM